MLANRRIYYSKEVNLENVKEKLSEQLSDKTCQDIEDFLSPKFDTHLPHGRRKWRIVQDGHGRWREINIDAQDEIQPGKCDITDKRLAKRTSVSPASSKLLFSNHILNTVKSASNLHSGRSSRQDSNYKTLSTNTRANIFPGVGKHDWFSQSNNVYTVSALKLGDKDGRDLQGGFYGITRDALGAWNEASVHHERMKKAWDVYLESLAKTGGGARPRKEPDRNTNLKSQEVDNKTKKIKKVKKSIKKQAQKETGEDIQHYESKDQQNLPQQTVIERDDDFWNFYEQPFVQSY